MIRKIFKTGHSAAVTLSHNLLKDMALKMGDAVKLEYNKENQSIIISHAKRQSQLSLGLKLRKKL